MNLDTQIFNLAKNNGFTDEAARFVVAQAHLESSDRNGKSYNSRVFRLNNNMYGMKFVGQRKASRGTLAPLSERSTPLCTTTNIQACRNSDFYAKYVSPLFSAEDTILRYYNITMRGVTPEMLKTAPTVEKFAELLKKRGYYGATIQQYTAGLKAKLRRINIIQGTGLINTVFPFLALAFFLPIG